RRLPRVAAVRYPPPFRSPLVAGVWRIGRLQRVARVAREVDDDLAGERGRDGAVDAVDLHLRLRLRRGELGGAQLRIAHSVASAGDRKSTRLNSSHVKISY